MEPPENLLDVLHLNFEYEAKCLSRKEIFLLPAQEPHRQPHSTCMQRLLAACLGWCVQQRNCSLSGACIRALVWAFSRCRLGCLGGSRRCTVLRCRVPH